MLKKNIMKMMIALFAAFILSSCMLPLASKSITNVDLNSKGTRVKLDKNGPLLILSLIPVDNSLEIKTVIGELQSKNTCSDLKNIEVETYNYSFYIVGWQKVVVWADCLK